MLAGELENLVVTAHLAHESMIAMTATAKPAPDTTSAMLCRRTIFVKAVTQAADKAMYQVKETGKNGIVAAIAPADN